MQEPSQIALESYKSQQQMTGGRTSLSDKSYSKIRSVLEDLLISIV